VAETTVKTLLCCVFRRTGKAMGQMYQCWWRICREIHVFSRLEYQMFHVLYPFLTYLLTLLRSFEVFSRSTEAKNDRCHSGRPNFLLRFEPSIALIRVWMLPLDQSFRFIIIISYGFILFCHE
jgi:hypothetical protein